MICHHCIIVPNYVNEVRGLIRFGNNWFGLDPHLNLFQFGICLQYFCFWVSVGGYGLLRLAWGLSTIPTHFHWHAFLRYCLSFISIFGFVSNKMSKVNSLNCEEFFESCLGQDTEIFYFKWFIEIKNFSVSVVFTVYLLIKYLLNILI